jgi:hypothetical protein
LIAVFWSDQFFLAETDGISLSFPEEFIDGQAEPGDVLIARLRRLADLHGLWRR